MRILFPAFSLLILAACAEGGPPPASGEQVRAYFPPGGVVDTIEVDAIERLPLRRAELVGPDGHATPASSVSARPAPSDVFSQQFPTGPYVGGAFGVSGTTGNGWSPAVVGAAPQTVTRLLATLSNASILLPDPVAYRQNWQKYRIRLGFGAPPGETQTRDIAAPQPPPLP